MPGAAKDVTDLMAHEFFDLDPSRGEVFARIEFFRFLRENLPDAGGKRQAQVGVNVDLGATETASGFDVGFGHAGGVLTQFAAVFIDFLDEGFGHAGGAVQHEGIITHTGIHQRLFNGFEAFEVKVLLALEFIRAVGVANRHREGIDIGLAHEGHGFFRVGINAALGVGAAFFAFIELSADQLAQLAFDHAIMFVGVIDYALADLDVLFEGFVAAIEKNIEICKQIGRAHV